VRVGRDGAVHTTQSTSIDSTDAAGTGAIVSGATPSLLPGKDRMAGVTSLLPQRHHRIYPRRAPRWDRVRHQRHGTQHA